MSFDKWISREYERKRIPSGAGDDLRHIGDYFLAEKESGGLGSDFEILKQFTFTRARDKARLWSERLARRAISEGTTLLRSEEVLRIYDENGWEVVVPKTPAACRNYAIGTRWCTLNPRTAQWYLEKGTLFIIRNKNKRDRNGNYRAFQLHLVSRQFMNDNDRHVNYQNMVPEKARTAIWQYESTHNPAAALKSIVGRAYPRRRRGKIQPLRESQAKIIKNILLTKTIQETDELESILEWAAWCNHVDLVRMILEHTGSGKIEKSWALILGIVQGRTEIVKLLLSECYLDERFQDWSEILAGLAHARRHTEIVEILKARNISIPKRFNPFTHASVFLDVSIDPEPWDEKERICGRRISQFPFRLFSARDFARIGLIIFLRRQIVETKETFDALREANGKCYFDVDLSRFHFQELGLLLGDVAPLKTHWVWISRRLCRRLYYLYYSLHNRVSDHRNNIRRDKGSYFETIRQACQNGLRTDISRRCTMENSRAQLVAQRIVDLCTFQSIYAPTLFVYFRHLGISRRRAR